MFGRIAQIKRAHLGLCLALAITMPSGGAHGQTSASAQRLHDSLLTLDSHMDTASNFSRPGWDIMDRHKVADQSQVDYPRMVEGGLKGGFFAIFTRQGPRNAQADLAARDDAIIRAQDIRQMLAKHGDKFELASKADDAAAIMAKGKRFVFMSIENSYPMEGDLSLMDTFQKLGVRLIGPVHSRNNDLADSATDQPEWHGLSPLGKEFVARANRLGLVLDASHASDDVLDQMIALSKTPIILSHSGSKAVNDNPRNIDDPRMKALAASGGVIQINSLSAYLIPSPKNPARQAAMAAFDEKSKGGSSSAEQERAMEAEYAAIEAKYPEPRATFDDYMKHMFHALKVAGVDHVGVGADMDGGGGVQGMEDIASYPKITAALLAAGYTREDVAKIWGGNVLRVLKEAEAYSASLKTKAAADPQPYAAVVTPQSSGPRPMTAQDLVALDRVSDPRVSPDGRWVAFEIATVDWKANSRVSSIWLTSTSGGEESKKLTEGFSPRWSADGTRLFFLAAADGTDQVWAIDPFHPERVPLQVTHMPLDISSFRISPDGKMLVISMAVFPEAERPGETKAQHAEIAASRASGKVYDKLFVRHWDTWSDGTKNHLFSLKIDADGVAAGGPVALMSGFDGDVPSKPFGGDGDYAIAPNSEVVAFSARQAGRIEPLSTNFDIYSVPIDGATNAVDMTAFNKAWDAGPVFSTDGKLLARRAMRRPGFESDRFDILVEDTATHEQRAVDPRWDRSAEKLAFSGDNKRLYVQATDDGRERLFSLDIASGSVQLLTANDNIVDFDVAHTSAGDVIVYTHDAINAPAEVFVLRPGQAPTQLTHAANTQLSGVKFSDYERFTFKGWHGEPVKGWVVKPYGYEPGKSYPAVYMIHGGPQGSWEDAWSIRSNAEVWAGWGYAVVVVDYHGSTGYGQAFVDAVSGHWGDRPLEDLRKGWAAALDRYKFIDGHRACVEGASYGGFMAYWIAGVWSQPWKCIIAHDGVFDNRMMGDDTDELWFTDWDNGHVSVSDKSLNYERFNPIAHVSNWTKPILIIHSEQDFRIPIDQGIAAFTAAQVKGVPSQLLVFDNENHFVTKPMNSLQWHQTVQSWLKRWNAPNDQ